MRKFHLIFGIVVLIVFVLTGQYMRIFHGRLHGMEDFPRILFRSRHIYILFASLVNISIGMYFNYWFARWRKYLQIAGSGLIAASSILLVVAFFYETSHRTFETPFSRFGVIITAVGVGFHLIASIGTEK